MTEETFHVSDADTKAMELAAEVYIAAMVEIVGQKTPQGWPIAAFRSSLMMRVLVTALCDDETVSDEEVILGAAGGLGQLLGMLEPAEVRAGVLNRVMQQLVSTSTVTASLIEPVGSKH